MFHEAVQLHPQPLTTSHICRKLDVGRNTGTLLKRRIQVLCSDLIPVVRELMKDAINADFSEDFELPDKSVDISEMMKGKAVLQGDVLALYNVTRKSNNYRTRYRANGSVASVYLNDKTAEERGFCQIGTLVLTQAMRKGPVLFTSIRDERQETVEPHYEWLPPQTVLWHDQSFPFLERGLFRNTRYVNHSLRAKNQKRNVWGKDRFSHLGTNNNCAEGQQGSLKVCMRNYRYVRPEKGQLYLNEYSLLKAIRVYGLERIVQKAAEMRAAGWKIGAVENGGELAQVVEGRQCGYLFDPEVPCTCPQTSVKNYFRKISGPILDRIDIEVLVPRVPYRDLLGGGGGEPSERVRTRVLAAREMQAARFQGSATSCNARMTNDEVKRHCALDHETDVVMGAAMKRLNLSARAFFRLLKVARTIADLAGREKLEKPHLLEALSYKNLQRTYEV